jgi:hypothetical protein
MIDKDEIDRVLGSMTREEIEDWLYHNRKQGKPKRNICMCGMNEKMDGEYYCEECLKKNPFLCA